MRLSKEKKHLKAFKEELKRQNPQLKPLISKYKPTDKKQLAVRGLV